MSGVRFYTETGSVYEVEYRVIGKGGWIRRESGNTPPTECLAPDGSWHYWIAMSSLEIGHPVQITWAPGAPHDFTITSFVTRIEEQ